MVGFRVLGPFEIVGPRGVVSLAPAELAVLAPLVLDAGRVVGADALVDGIWGERPPSNPGNALQLRVSKLRRALQAAGLPELVVTRRPGYLVDAASETVDAHRFARLVAEARRAGPAVALGLYEQALGLWRGPALPEFADRGWAVPEVTRLQELRLAAVEERVELELAAGRHAALAGELEALVAEHPLRERLHGQLMRALYRAGRQADALAAYRRTRQVLDEELGLEPSPELRSLEQAILRQDPSLTAPAPPAGPVAGPELPARLSSFVGRDRELAQVRELLGRHRTVTLTGPGGVGKTSLALEAARDLAAFPDGVHLVRLAGTADEARVPEVVAEALGLAPVAELTVPAQLAGHLRHRSALLVLDNCEHLAAACAALTEQLLERCPRLAVLATSREPLGTPGEARLAVPPLDVPAEDAGLAELPAAGAVRLLLDRITAAEPGFVLDAGTAPHVGCIARRLDGIPLALELAAARVRALPVAELAARLEDQLGVLTAGPRTAAGRQRTIRATLDWSHRLLSEPEAVLFRRLAVFRGGWTLAAAEQVCAGPGLPRAEVLDVLARLVDRSLVVADRGAGPRFHLLEIMRQYAAEQLEAAGETEATGAAHARYVTELAEAGLPGLRTADQGRALALAAAERDNVEAALAWCRTHAGAEPAIGLRLVAALGWYWWLGSREDGGSQADAVIRAAGAAAEPGDRARALLGRTVAGRPGACIVHPDPDCARAAREGGALFAAAGDRLGEAYMRTMLAVEAVSGPGVAEALALVDDAQQRFREHGDRWGEGLAEFVLMELRFASGATQRATESGDRALELFGALGDHWSVSAVRYHLGLALHRAGRWDAARAAYRTALAEGRRDGTANTVQYALAHLGHVALAEGETAQAELFFAESHCTAARLGAEGSPVAALGEGELALARGDRETARGRYAAARRLAHGRPDWTSAALAGLARIARDEGDGEVAERLGREAWRLAREGAAPGPAATALEGLAAVAVARGDGPGGAALLGAAARWRQVRHVPPTPAEREDAERTAAAGRALLGDRAWAAALAAAPADPAELLTAPAR